jgi:hypothetical protein
MIAEVSQMSRVLYSQVEDEIKKLDPVCEFLNKVQSKNCTLGEGLHFWLELEEEYSYYETSWKDRTRMMMTEPALFSYIFHPKYKGCKLSAKYKQFAESKLLRVFGPGTGWDTFLDYMESKSK